MKNLNHKVRKMYLQSEEITQKTRKSSTVKVAPLCVILCDPMDGLLQARMLEWVVFSSPADFPSPGIEPRSPAFQVDSLPAELPGTP